MQYQRRTLQITTPQDLCQRLPLNLAGLVLSGIPPLVQGALRLAIDGASQIPGQPAWLRRASDIRLVQYGHSGEETTLTLELPHLGDAARDLYQQQEFWATRPAPDNTALDVLSQVVAEVSQENGESPWLDPELLKRFSRLRKVFGPQIQSIRVLQAQTSPVLNAAVVASAARLSASLPPSRPVRVLGKLDMIRHSTRGFELELASGQRASGVLVNAEDPAQLAPFFGQSILVVGRAVYRPSGALLRLEAESIQSGAGESSLFSRVPGPIREQSYTSRLRSSSAHPAGVGAFFGAWPGEESDEELQHQLQSLRHSAASR